MPGKFDLVVNQVACEQATIVPFNELGAHMPSYIHPASGVLSRIHLYDSPRDALSSSVSEHRQPGVFQDHSHLRSDSLPS